MLCKKCVEPISKEEILIELDKQPALGITLMEYFIKQNSNREYTTQVDELATRWKTTFTGLITQTNLNDFKSECELHGLEFRDVLDKINEN